ncbi:MAG: 4'-phosphopantetheinyl transferase superfamily protein [Methyloglobulus sp.]|nr:4'-phosphopantetheinyl transferase superfamily protein [Methyloglobulus sp.]
MNNRDIDLWFEDLSVNDNFHYYWSLLDENEQTKAKRFIQEKHRHYYVISHGKLREILASYIHIAPEKIKFDVGAFGKPFTIANGKPHNLKFNLSHSDNRMVVAVGYHDNIGVDIEVWNDKMDCHAIAKECFAEVEATYWQGLPDSAKPVAFYRFWTRKESFAKAVGAGITLGVSQVITSVDEPTRFLSVPDCYGAASDWTVVDFDFGTEISAALTVNTINNEQINFKSLSQVGWMPSTTGWKVAKNLE